LRTIAEQGLGREKLNRILAGGVIEGAPVETIRTLRDELSKIHGETVPIVDKNGDTINYAAKDYAEMVARTQTRQATTIARHERLESNGVDLVSIVGRVSTNFCTAFLGQVFSLSGKSDKYPALSSLPGGAGPYPPPPFHPHCSKSTRPVRRLPGQRQAAARRGDPGGREEAAGHGHEQGAAGVQGPAAASTDSGSLQDHGEELFAGARLTSDRRMNVQVSNPVQTLAEGRRKGLRHG
jgi:hypothetical protein